MTAVKDSHNSAGHTPGPWKLETVPTQIGICHKIGPLPGIGGKAAGYACIYVDHRRKGDEQWDAKCAEQFANARLMTAAPELLAAAERCLRHFEAIRPLDMEDSPMMLQCRQAIRRARYG